MTETENIVQINVLRQLWMQLTQLLFLSFPWPFFSSSSSLLRFAAFALSVGQLQRDDFCEWRAADTKEVAILCVSKRASPHE